MNEENENIEQICSYLLSQEILWLITPPGEYDHKSNTFWLEESQGISQTEETWNAQLMLQLKESGIKIVIGLNRRIYKEYGVYHILYSLKFQINEQLEVLKEQTKFNPTNLMRLDFQISEIEIWNQKSNFINKKIKDQTIRADTLILKSDDNRQLLIQALESPYQENCIQLRFMNEHDKDFDILKKHELELIYKSS